MSENDQDLTSEEKEHYKKLIKKHQDENPKIKDFSHFLKVFQNETDRGAVLVAGTLLEEKLRVIIESFLINTKESSDILSGFNAPLGTFSARLKMAYSLGLITNDEYFDCNLIRKIRNEFAHRFDLQFSFNDKKVIKLCGQLKADLPGDKTDFLDNPRFVFINGVILLVLRWLYREDYVIKHRLQYKEWN